MGLASSGKKAFTLALAALAFWSVSSNATEEKNSKSISDWPQLSAGVRESFITSQSFMFGSDRMARVKALLIEAGFKSVSAHLRLGMQTPTSSKVYSPFIRSNITQVETLLSRMNHTRGELILKPVISIAPGLGIAARATNIDPADKNVWFTTYLQSLRPYIVLSGEHEIAEIVLGTGLHNLWKAAYAAKWKALIYEVRNRITSQGGLRTRLSFELSSADDIQAFENWRVEDPKSFRDVIELIDRIRLSVSPVEGTQGKGDWDVEKTADQIESLITRAADLFTNKGLVLANVVIPGCKEREYDEDEVKCVRTGKARTPEEKAADDEYQARGLITWNKSIAILPPDIRTQILEIEMLAATTEYDPAPGKEDPRFLIFSKKMVEHLLPKKADSTKPTELTVPVPTPTPAIVAPPPPPVILELPAGPAPKGKPAEKKKTSRGPASALDLIRGPNDPVKTACVLFDDTGKKNDFLGPIHARMLETLLGSFRNWQVKVIAARLYKPRQLDACDAAFYISSNFQLELSKSLLADMIYLSHQKPLVWMNYKFPIFSNVFNEVAEKTGTEKLAFEAPKIIPALNLPGPLNTDPGFYRYFDYKGETFEKLARWDPIGNWFSASPEINEVLINDAKKVTVHSIARHTKQPSFTPYVVSQKIANGKIWYFADLPLAFVHPEDRYFIFCDLLWDILGETPPTGPPSALVRIEDVNPTQDQGALRWAIDYLADNDIPFSMAVIPQYSNIFAGNAGQGPIWKPAYKYPHFVGILKYAKARGANFVFHGLAHQAGDLISGYDGTSGADYEFWKFPNNGPLPFDSSDYVLDRLEQGEKIFKKLDITPVAWEAPHYAASALDYVLFGHLFEWNYHRAIYFKAEDYTDAPLRPDHHMFECVTDACRAERRSIARGIKAPADYTQFGGQIVPYPVWRDAFGQSIIPETLGMIDYAFYHKDSPYAISHPGDIVRRAKKLRVVRGAFASFFWHADNLLPHMTYYKEVPGNYETEGGKNTLIKTIEGIQALGYQFRSISDCSLFPRSQCYKK